MLALEVVEVASANPLSSPPATATATATSITVMAWEERGSKRGSSSPWATQKICRCGENSFSSPVLMKMPWRPNSVRRVPPLVTHSQLRHWLLHHVAPQVSRLRRDPLPAPTTRSNILFGAKPHRIISAPWTSLAS